MQRCWWLLELCQCEVLGWQQRFSGSGAFSLSSHLFFLVFLGLLGCFLETYTVVTVCQDLSLCSTPHLGALAPYKWLYSVNLARGLGNLSED